MCVLQVILEGYLKVKKNERVWGMPVEDSFFTRSVHSAMKIEPSTGAVITPIFATSTYKQSAPGEHLGYDYSRGANPTRTALEDTLAQLEKASYGLAFSSGLAAEQAIIHRVKPGSKVLVSDDVYGGTGRLFRKLYSHYGIEFKFIDMTNEQELERELTKEVSLVWIETPTNPTLKIIDIAKVSAKAKTVSAVTVVDNTFSSPVFQSPLELGADVVVHSMTKYIGGHCDIIGGAIMTNDKKLYEELSFVQMAIGAILSPFECFLVSRSVKTLAIRMAQHEKTALKVAQFLAQEKKCEKVLYPGLETHPQHILAKKQMKGFSGMISFELKGNLSVVTRFLSSLKVIILAESLGGVESLINHPEKMTHASVPEEDRRKLGIHERLLRLSVGIEDAKDIINDLERGFARI